MFSKNSRYKELKDIVLKDIDSLEKKSKLFRHIPKTEGVIKHQVTEADRLDILAFTYYKDSQLWWKICDANPEYMMPTALLNNEPFVTEDFHLDKDSDIKKLPLAIKKLEDSKGVIKTKVNQFELDYQGENWRQVGNSEEIAAFKQKIQVIYNENETDQYTLKKILKEENIKVTGIEKITATGRQINIPAK